MTSDNGQPLAIVVLKDRSPLYAKTYAYLFSIAWKLGLTMMAIVPLMAFLTSGTMRRLIRLTTATSALAQGDIKVAIPETHAGDEFGQLARALLIF